MLLQSEQLNKARADYRNSPDVDKSHADRMKRYRNKKKKQTKLNDLNQYLGEASYQEAQQKINEEYEQLNKKSLIKEGSVPQNPLKGKATTDFNNFLYSAFYLIKKEMKTIQDKVIYEWLKDFLSEKEHMKPNGKPFRYTNISSRIASFKKLPNDIKEHFYIIFEAEFEDFCKRKRYQQ
jgi:hypothetical protein